MNFPYFELFCSSPEHRTKLICNTTLQPSKIPPFMILTKYIRNFKYLLEVEVAFER